MVSARCREKVQKHFEIPQEIPKTFETFQEFLSSNWHNWSNLHALPTASLYAGLLMFSEVGFLGVVAIALGGLPWKEGWETDLENQILSYISVQRKSNFMHVCL
jgi:hypothetical protein